MPPESFRDSSGNSREGARADAFAQRAQLLLETRFYRGVLSMTRGFLTFVRDTAVEAIQDPVPEDESRVKAA